MDLDSIVQELSKLLIGEEELIIWLGAGLSISNRYPDWVNLINELARRCGFNVRVNERTPSDTLLEIASRCKNTNREVFKEVFVDIFGRQPSETRIAYFYISKLSCKAFITTNYDPLLVQAVELNNDEKCKVFYKQDEMKIRNMYNNEPGVTSVFHIHGRVGIDEELDIDQLVVTKEDYDQAYKNSEYLSTFLGQVFLTYPILFLGYSMKDKHVKEELELIKSTLEHYGQESTKVLLLSTEIQDSKLLDNDEEIDREAIERQREIEKQRNIENNEDQENERIGIKVLRYYPAKEGLNGKPTHEEIEVILSKLNRLMRDFDRDATGKTDLPGL